MGDETGTFVYTGSVKSEWIDCNKHMNVAYYGVAFDRAVDLLFEGFGITEHYIENSLGTSFAVESHMTYQKEMNEGDEFRVTAQILAYDDKRIHQFQRLYHAAEGYLAATAEWMNLHVDLAARRVTPWPEPIRESLAEFVAGQTQPEAPPEAGKRMLIRDPLYSSYRSQ